MKMFFSFDLVLNYSNTAAFSEMGNEKKGHFELTE